MFGSTSKCSWGIQTRGRCLENVLQECGKDARKPFAKAKQTAKGKPQVMVTDGLHAYIDAFKKEFFTLRNPRTKHIRKPRFIDRTNNNIVERLQGTIRKREKVMRGLKTERTAKAMIEGYRAYYNFIRPHQSLNGKTPAEMANIDLGLERNKWLSLIKISKNGFRHDLADKKERIRLDAFLAEIFNLGLKNFS